MVKKWELIKNSFTPNWYTVGKAPVAVQKNKSCNVREHTENT